MTMETDVGRFRRIVRGRIKQNLARFIQSGELLGRQGGKQVRIPLPRIDLPRFQYGENSGSGVAQGDGEAGAPVPGTGEAGEGAGDHTMEVDVSLEELADILGEELGLPRIDERGKKFLPHTKLRYRGVLRTGPESLRNFKRTFKESIRRQIASGTYDPDNPIIVPVREDKRFRSTRTEEKPEASAAIVYMMDVSGSMGDEQKEIVRLTAFWLDTWIKRHYKSVETRYVIHDAIAQEVDQKTFYQTKESGGTLISSAYKLCLQLLETHYPPALWNNYIFHFSDGDNWSGNDTAECLALLENRLLPSSNLFGYGQVESRYGSGQFLRDLEREFGIGTQSRKENLILQQIKDKQGILSAIQGFLGKGS